jgi:NADPH:quinone reductase-like Zn-dependent oxidoreductase
MKAIIQERFGPPDILQLVDTDPPEVGADDVLVRVHAAALNPYDWHIMRGDPLISRLMGEVGLRKPKARVAGVDAAGRVEAVGANVRRLRPGDEVLGFCQGAFAEYARAEADKVVPKPVSLSFEQAAAVPMAGTTALRGIRDVGAVRAGHRVLVNGAAGGVGTYAVQIAAALGAEVTGVCSTRNVELVRSIGAAHVVDYTKEDFTEGRAHYDVVLDNVCNRPLSQLRSGRWAPFFGRSWSTVSSESGSDCSRTNRSGSNYSPSPDSSRPGNSHRSSTGRTRWPTRPRACAAWSRGTHAARS